MPNKSRKRPFEGRRSGGNAHLTGGVELWLLPLATSAAKQSSALYSKRQIQLPTATGPLPCYNLVQNRPQPPKLQMDFVGFKRYIRLLCLRLHGAGAASRSGACVG